MPSPTPVLSRRLLAPAAIVGLIVTSIGLGAHPASAAVSPDAAVVINEVYGGGGNNGAAFNRDFVELANVSDADVNLNGWSVQYTSASGGTWQTTPLGAVTLAAGKTLVVGEAFGSNQSLPAFDVDVDGSIAMSGTGGKVALVNSTAALSGAANMAQSSTVVDYVGWGAATDFAGAAAPATTNGTSVSRNEAHANTANNAADFVAQAPTPTPQGSEPVDPVDPTVQDLTIAEIQGTGETSPVVGVTARTQGVVTALYPTGGLDGYVLQTAGSGGQSDLGSHLSSEALFIYSRDTVGSVAIGDTVEVTGVVSEWYGLTQLTVKADGLKPLPAASAPLPITAAWPADAAGRETLESMLYQPSEPFTVSNTYDTQKYGEVPLAFGSTPLRQPTDVALPNSAEAQAVVADNAARAVILDDASTINFSNAANTSMVPPYISLTEPIIVGASATLTEPHIVDFRNDVFKLNPTHPLVSGEDDGVAFENTRTAAPAEVGGDVTVASFNVLNYFTTLGIENPSCVPYTDRAGNPVTVKEGCDQRGAWGEADFARQQEKIVAAINGLDASVIGLMEIENSAALGEAPDEALATLVTALNAAAGSEKWAYVASASNLPDVSQQDVITNAVIYQPAEVKPVGAAVALGDQSASGQAFGNAREPIAQTFSDVDGGKPFTVVVNHFKSKGSVGPWPGDVDKGDGQGTSVESRVRQATALKDWIATDPTQSGSADVLLVGDFNSYGQEDPLQVLYAAGFVDAEQQFDVEKSTYVFQGLSGSLDHVLLSSSIIERTTGAAVWGINSGEALMLEYSRYNATGALYHEANPYRSSDHDPVLVGLDSQIVAPVISTVTYEFVAADGSALPAEVTALLPAASEAAEGTSVTPAPPAQTTVVAGGGTWTFGSWSPASQTANGAPLTFVGTWTFVADPEPETSTISHSFVAGEAATARAAVQAAGDLPEEVLALLPASFTAEVGETVTPTPLAKTEVTVDDGTWTFAGWTPESIVVTDADATFTGTWTFAPSTTTPTPTPTPPSPTPTPTSSPTPTSTPTSGPTTPPTAAPTAAPTTAPTAAPTTVPTPTDPLATTGTEGEIALTLAGILLALGLLVFGLGLWRRKNA